MKPTPAETPLPLEALANSILSTSCYPAVRTVRCELREGELVLIGTLPSYYHKQIAQGLVTQLEGFVSIKNCIEVGGDCLQWTDHSGEPRAAEVDP